MGKGFNNKQGSRFTIVIGWRWVPEWGLQSSCGGAQALRVGAQIPPTVPHPRSAHESLEGNGLVCEGRTLVWNREPSIHPEIKGV